MTDIVIKKDTVEMTITYSRKFESQHECNEAVAGAMELRGLVIQEEAPNDDVENPQGL